MDDTQPPDDTDTATTTSDAAGNRRVEAALERLKSLDDLPVAEHVAVYAAAHADLRDALAEAASRDTTEQT